MRGDRADPRADWGRTAARPVPPHVRVRSDLSTLRSRGSRSNTRLLRGLSYRSRMTSINYDLPDDLHRAAKVAAARRGVSLKAFVIEALEAAVAASEKPAARRPHRK